jgi:phosphoribosylglycinamide formyltransferase-1
MRRNTAIFISGRGSNMEALIAAAQSPDYPAEIALVISNRSDAAGLKIARRHRVPTKAIDHRRFETREAFEAEIGKALEAADIDLICLAGFMRLLTEGFVKHWEDRLVNIHPSLLPSFRGIDTHARALAAGVKIAGCTVHFVRPEMDAGPIIAQAAVAVLPDDTAETLAARVLEAEHRIYPMAVRLVASDRARVVGGRVVVEARGGKGAALFSPPVESHVN